MSNYQVQLDQFSGPLDLLWQLIEKQDLDLAEISLAEVTDQYLDYIEKSEGIPAEEMADFLVVATKLLYLKSKLILPVPEEEPEDETHLADQIRLFREFVRAAEKLEIQWEKNNKLFIPQFVRGEITESFLPPEELTKDDLKKYWLLVLARLRPLVKVPKVIIEKTVSLKDKMINLRALLAERKEINFVELLEEAGSRTEVVVSFLAILELLRKQEVSVCQNENFHNITIQRGDHC